MESEDFGLTSTRAFNTAPSCIKQVVPLMKPGISNMGHGMVHWTPPKECLDELPQLLSQVGVHRYGAIEGIPDLIAALKEKVAKKNKLSGEKDIIVTAGGNQAFMNIVLAICDPGDEVVLFAPYYFNNIMALQLANVTPVIVPCKEDLTPDIAKITFTPKTKMVVLVTPSNPSGAVVPESTIRELQQKCLKANVWLVSDEAYEDFIYNENNPHYSADGKNVINIYSFSKAYGMHGWRVGYMVFSPNSHLKSAVDKVQDTIPINCCQLSQRLALSVLQKAGSEWVKERVAALKTQREIVWDAVSQMKGTVKTDGAFYFMVKLPDGVKDMDAVTYLAKEWNVMVLPCNSAGLQGYLRVSYGNLSVQECTEASSRLKQGLKAILDGALNKSV